MDQFLRTADLLQKLRGLDAVLLRPLFKVHIVEEAHGGPEIGIFTIAKLVGIPAHDALYRQGMLNVERLAVVLFQQSQGFFSCRTGFHRDRSFVLLISVSPAPGRRAVSENSHNRAAEMCSRF